MFLLMKTLNLTNILINFGVLQVPKREVTSSCVVEWEAWKKANPNVPIRGSLPKADQHMPARTSSSNHQPVTSTTSSTSANVPERKVTAASAARRRRVVDDSSSDSGDSPTAGPESSARSNVSVFQEVSTVPEDNLAVQPPGLPPHPSQYERLSQNSSQPSQSQVISQTEQDLSRQIQPALLLRASQGTQKAPDSQQSAVAGPVPVSQQNSASTQSSTRLSGRIIPDSQSTNNSPFAANSVSAIPSSSIGGPNRPIVIDSSGQDRESSNRQVTAAGTDFTPSRNPLAASSNQYVPETTRRRLDAARPSSSGGKSPRLSKSAKRHQRASPYPKSSGYSLTAESQRSKKKSKSRKSSRAGSMDATDDIVPVRTSQQANTVAEAATSVQDHPMDTSEHDTSMEDITHSVETPHVYQDSLEAGASSHDGQRPAPNAIRNVSSRTVPALHYTNADSSEVGSRPGTGDSAFSQPRTTGGIRITLPLRMPQLTFEAYEGLLKKSHDQGLLQELFGAENMSQARLDAIKQLVQKLCSVIFHPDLVISEQDLTQHPADQFAKYTTTVSSRFSFLAPILTQRYHSKFRIAIVVSGQPAKRILDEFVRGNAIQASNAQPLMPNEQGPEQGVLPEIVTIDHSSESCTAHITAEPYNMVIGMTHDFDVDSPLMAEFDQATPANRSCTFIWTMVPYSIEHILGHLNVELMGQSSLRMLMEKTIELRHKVRQLRDQLPPPQTRGETIGRLFSSGQSVSSLSSYPLLSDLEPLDFVLRLSPPRNSVTDVASIRTKRRASDDLDGESAPKKAKSVTPAPPTVSAHDVTHITDTTINSSAEHIADIMDKYEAAMKAAARSKEEIDGLNTVIRSMEQWNKHLTGENHKVKRQLAEMEDLRQRNAQLQETNTTVRAKNKTLEQDIAQTRALNAGSDIPAVRDAEAARAQQELAEKLQEKIKRAESDKDYFLGLYQSAGEGTNTLRGRVSELEAENEILQRKASEEKRYCAEVYKSTVSKADSRAVEMARAEVKLMKTNLENREKENDVLREENERLKERLGAGLSTRSTRAISPAPGSRLGTPALGATSMSRASSRQGTPQPPSSSAGARPKPAATATPAHRSHLRETYMD